MTNTVHLRRVDQPLQTLDADADQVFFIGMVIRGRQQIADRLDQINHEAMLIDSAVVLTAAASERLVCALEIADDAFAAEVAEGQTQALAGVPKDVDIVGREQIASYLDARQSLVKVEAAGTNHRDVPPKDPSACQVAENSGSDERNAVQAQRPVHRCHLLETRIQLPVSVPLYISALAERTVDFLRLLGLPAKGNLFSGLLSQQVDMPFPFHPPHGANEASCELCSGVLPRLENLHHIDELTSLGIIEFCEHGSL